MKRFEFRLARLERLRALERDAARAALARASAVVEERRARREQRRLALEDALQTELPPALSTDPRAWEQLAEWRHRQRRAVIDAAKREAEADQAARLAEQQHVEAARNHRVLERLRERKYRRWREEANLEERKSLDEIHLLRLNSQRTRRGER